MITINIVSEVSKLDSYMLCGNNLNRLHSRISKSQCNEPVLFQKIFDFFSDLLIYWSDLKQGYLSILRNWYKHYDTTELYKHRNYNSVTVTSFNLEIIQMRLHHVWICLRQIIWWWYLMFILNVWKQTLFPCQCCYLFQYWSKELKWNI